MDELDPRDVLKLYRERSPDHITEQARKFRRLADKDRDELLFYMASHLVMAMQTVTGGETQSLADVAFTLRGGNA